MKLKNVNVRNSKMMEDLKVQAVENSVLASALEDSKKSQERARKERNKNTPENVAGTTAIPNDVLKQATPLAKSVMKHAKDRDELKEALNLINKNNIKTSIRRSKNEGYRFEILRKSALNEELKVITDFSDYKPWQGAVNFYHEIEDAGLLDDLENLLEEMFPDGVEMVQINDTLWFDQDWIKEQLGMDIEDDTVEEGCTKSKVNEDLNENIATVTISKGDYEVLVDLRERLIDNYNNDTPFEQLEEDRLVIGHIVDDCSDLFDKTSEVVGESKKRPHEDTRLRGQNKEKCIGNSCDNQTEVKEECKGLKESLSMQENLKMISDFSDYKPWGNAVAFYNEIKANGLLDTLEGFLEEMFPDGVTATQINDVLWFDQDFVRMQIGMTTKGHLIDENPNFKEEEVDINEI